MTKPQAVRSRYDEKAQRFVDVGVMRPQALHPDAPKRSTFQGMTPHVRETAKLRGLTDQGMISAIESSYFIKRLGDVMAQLEGQPLDGRREAYARAQLLRRAVAAELETIDLVLLEAAEQYNLPAPDFTKRKT